MKGSWWFRSRLEVYARRLRIISTTSPPVLARALSFKLRRWIVARLQRLYVLFFLPRRERSLRRRGGCAIREDVKFFALTDLPGDRDDLLAIWRRDFGDSPEKTLDAAEAAIGHRFDLLGSGPTDLGPDIDWTRDFKSGRRWENVYFEKLRTIKLSDDSDIKVPWELSRCYHFVALGKAYLATGDERYAMEFLDQVESWAAQNPPYHGVNWHQAMEVSIRAVNWIWGYFFFKDSVHFTPEKKGEFAILLYFHGEYIQNNLEWDQRVVDGEYRRQHGNHFVADITGLVYLGAVLEAPGSRKWLETGLAEVSRELRIQVLEDGAHWELAPSYHRLVLEMFLSAVILARQNGAEIEREPLDRLESMVDFTHGILRPDGLCPLLRDADDGRLHLLGHSSFRDHRHVLAAGAAYFDRPDLLPEDRQTWEDCLWLFGVRRYDALCRWAPVRAPSRSRAFETSGFYVLRSEDELHITVVCAGTGMRGRAGGHCHSDALSFELCSRGETLLADSGTFVYSADPEQRNRFRSTAAHSTIRVDEEEINRFPPWGLFLMHNDGNPRVRRWSSSDAVDYLDAEHLGYRRLPEPVTHRRRFLLDKERRVLLIDDLLSGRGSHKLEVFWHFSPGVALERRGDAHVVRGRRSALRMAFDDTTSWKSELIEGAVSEGYGRRQPNVVLRLSRVASMPVRLRTCLLRDGETEEKSEDLFGVMAAIMDAMDRRASETCV